MLRALPRIINSQKSTAVQRHHVQWQACVMFQRLIDSLLLLRTPPTSPVALAVNIHLTTERHVRQLNRDFRQQDRSTDVLSFPSHSIVGVPQQQPRLCVEGGLVDAGEIFICMALVKRQCKAADQSLEGWLPVLMAHGLCHLVGMTHDTDENKKQMNQYERLMLQTLRTKMERRLPPVQEL